MRFSVCGSPVRWALLSSLMVLGAVGCGSKTATVSGKVTLNGEPLKGGNVTFARSDGQPTVSSPIGEDGSYKAENVPVGTANVCVETKSLNPALTLPKMAGNKPAGPLVNKPSDPNVKLPEGYNPDKSGTGSKVHLYVAIPDKYADPKTTDITYEVKSGKQEKTIELTNK